MSFSADEPRWRCDCGGYLLLEGAGMFTRQSLMRRSPNIWRYREALGISVGVDPVSLGEGMTPLIETRLGRLKVSLKVDYLCPTGSYKDRGSAVMITKLREWGLSQIIEDSSGNAGASIAAYAGLAGIQSDIYVPDSTSAGKAAQISLYGAKLMKIPGTREDTARAAWNAAAKKYYASHNWNPYFMAGMKTVAHEIAEQSGWSAPEWVVVPAGGGGLLCGVYCGFKEMLHAGLVDRMPRLAAVQAAACDPIYRAWKEELHDIPAVKKSDTAAEGISVAQPVRGRLILEAIRKSNGLVTTVTDDEIWAALPMLGEAGLYVEPTSAAAPAAFRRLRSQGLIAEDASAVVVLTGSGLKATDKIVQHYFTPEPARM